MSSNSSMAYSYYGEIKSKTVKVEGQQGMKYSVAEYKFNVPILINGSAVVELSGSNSLSVSSKEGIFIGVDIEVGKTRAELEKIVGAFCVGRERAGGNTPILSLRKLVLVSLCKFNRTHSIKNLIMFWYSLKRSGISELQL